MPDILTRKKRGMERISREDSETEVSCKTEMDIKVTLSELSNTRSY